MSDIPHSLEGTLDQLLDEQNGDHLSIRELVDAFDGAALGPLLLCPALLAVTPLGAVPGVPTAMAILIALVALQGLFRSGKPWVPGPLANRSVDQSRLRGAADKARPWFRRIDHVTTERFSFMTRRVGATVAAGVALLLAALMVPLEFVPFAAMLPALGVLLIGLALTARDGLLLCVGLLVAAGTLVGSYWLLQSI